MYEDIDKTRREKPDVVKLMSKMAEAVLDSGLRENIYLTLTVCSQGEYREAEEQVIDYLYNHNKYPPSNGLYIEFGQIQKVKVYLKKCDPKPTFGITNRNRRDFY